MPFDSVSKPPEAAVEVRCWVLDSFSELRQLRASLFAALTGEPMPPDGVLDEVPEKMAVVATELATNALAHGRPPTCVYLRRTEHTFVLDVADNDPTFPQPTGPRPPGAGGLGLHIVDEIAGDVGWYADNSTKHIWAQFPIPVDADADAP
jgi:hypothetical protein